MTRRTIIMVLCAFALAPACKGGTGTHGPDAGAAEVAREGAGAAQEANERPDPRDALKTRVACVALDRRDPGVLFAGATAGLVEYDVPGKGAPVEKGVVHLPGAAVAIAQEGAMLAVATGPTGVALVDVAKKGEPRLVATVVTGGGAVGAAFVGPRELAVADGTMGVALVDIADPAAPRILERWMTTGYVRGVAVERAAKGTYLYAAASAQGILLFDVSLPGKLDFLASAGEGAEVRSLALAGGTVYAAAGAAGLVVAERKERSLAELWRFAPGLKDMVRGVALDETARTACLTAGESGLVVLDVSIPGAAKKTGELVYEKPFNRAAARGDLLFVAADSAGVVVLDVSKPAQIKLLSPEKP